MTTNKPNVQRYADMGCPEQICRVDTMHESDDGDFVLYEDYEALQSKCERLEKALSAYQAAVNKIDDRIEYALPMPPETKAALHAILADLTATLAQEGGE